MAAAPIDFTASDAGEESLDTGIDQGQQPDSGFEQQGLQDQQQSAGAEQVDGRRGPANIRNSIKAATEAMPEHAATFKELGNAHFREQAYRQHFPTPQEAATAKQLIEGIGGVEGATALQSRIQTYDAQDAGLQSGDPAVLDAMFKDFPDGAAALAPHYLDKLAQSNQQAYSAAVAPHAIAMLENAGIPGFVEGIANESDPARAKAMVQQLQQWIQQQSQGVQQLKQAPAKDPRADKLAQQQQELTQEKEKLFADAVQGKVNSSVVPEIQKAVDSYAKQYKLNDTQKAHFQTTLQNRIVAEMQADKTYEQQVNLRKANKGRTHDTVASYISSEFNRRIKDAAFATAKDVYGAPRQASTQQTGVPKADSPKTAPSGGPLFVTQRPPDSELDLSRPGADMLLIQGRGYTKGGRFVTWRK